MVLTIAPAVRGEKLSSLLLSHGLGLAVGALVAALALTLVGAGVAAAWSSGEEVVVGTAGAVALLWLPRTAGLGYGPRWPRRSWQVPEQWRYTLPMPVTLFSFGFMLGLGFLTTPVLPVFWLLAGLTVWVASLPLAIAAWFAYAAARWIMTARGSRRVVMTRVIPDDVHGARGFRIARALSVAILLATALAGVLAVRPF